MDIACSALGLGQWAAAAGDLSDAATSPTPEAASWSSTGKTGNAYIDGVMSGQRWTGAITYSFPNAASAYEVGITEATDAFRQVSFAQMQAARAVLEGYSPYSGGPRMGMTAFEQFTNASISDAGFGTSDLRIARSDSANPTAYAYYPSNNPRGGDVWFGSNYDYTNPLLGTYQYATMVHELGHALGLKHGHDVGGVANAAVPSDRDSMEFTVMTYRSYIGQDPNGYTNESYGYAQTFMMLDIAALQVMYGANYSTQNGNSVYSWSPTTGETFINGVGQGAPGSGTGGSANRVFLTVWDGGGIDTYDFSNYATDLRVDLSPGGWSTLSPVQLANLGDGHYARGNVFNALQYNSDPRSLIENAIGGAGSDVLTGNAVANRLTGAAGNDTLDGGTGMDTAVFSGPQSSYRLYLLTDGSVSVRDLRTGSPDGIDICRNIEAFEFSDGLFTGTITPQTSRTTTRTDDADQFAWATVVTTKDADNRTTKVNYYNDDGTQIVYEYDVDDLFVRSTLITKIDTSRRSTEIYYINDDGSSFLYEYDLANKAAWLTLRTDIDAKGRTTQVNYTNDSGTHTAYEYDLDDKYSWTSAATYFDANWKRQSVVYDNDDGTHAAVSFDANGVAIATRIFNSNWDVIA